MISVPPKQILVPTDFSEPASHALRYASSLAQRFDATILVVHADTFIHTADLTQSELMHLATVRLERYARGIVSPVVAFEARVIAREPINTIVDLCESHDLIIMGTHGRTGLGLMLFGSVTAAVMRMASVPVIALNRSADASIRRVICPVTQSSTCVSALRYAAALSDGKIVLIPGVDTDDLQGVVKKLISVEEQIRVELADRCDVVGAQPGDSADQIVVSAAASDANLIVIEVPSNRRVLDLLRGTIAEKVVALSDCPVLTLNARAARALDLPLAPRSVERVARSAG